MDIEGQSLRHLERCVDNEFAHIFSDEGYVIDNVVWMDSKTLEGSKEIRPVVYVTPIFDYLANNIILLFPPLNINKV
jgi:hypothetical protein